jgi:hypothetical protein
LLKLFHQRITRLFSTNKTKFDGNRYTFEVLVESIDSAERIGSRLRQQFDDGLTLVGSEHLSALRTEVYADEEQ